MMMNEEKSLALNQIENRQRIAENRTHQQHDACAFLQRSHLKKSSRKRPETNGLLFNLDIHQMLDPQYTPCSVEWLLDRSAFSDDALNTTSAALTHTCISLMRRFIFHLIIVKHKF